MLNIRLIDFSDKNIVYIDNNERGFINKYREVNSDKFKT